MFPLWDVAIAPVLHAARARRIVEIGALRGETTVQMLDDLGPDAELHVIDPVPEFDPREHERQFPGRYYFHEALSLDVLPDARADGRGADRRRPQLVHGLQRAAAARRRARARRGAPLPVLILHDVLLAVRPPRPLLRARADPRRSSASRTPSGACGRAARSCSTRGGLNPTMCNAVEEGGPRNGVMTALDDFIAEYDRAAAGRRAPDLLRAGDRRRGGAPRTASPSSPRCSTGSRAPTGRRACWRWPRRSASGR